ncbi:hypothetical protein STAS_02047 [Striga asiatica]|uniref:DUF1985 domain-containing protein n=1 Tax=Striga asiatica TaxID=4170 RepID=A0A5A7P1A5_STRAF|nr:hypothetical protein STAS_02047 [Striga asiatica]
MPEKRKKGKEVSSSDYVSDSGYSEESSDSYEFVSDGDDDSFVRLLPNFNRYETIQTIRNMSTESQLEMLKKSCFGKFFELPFGIVQSQLVHLVLLRQVFQKNSEELWVDLCGKIMKFGIGEFSVLTGLKCVGNASKLLYQSTEDGLFNKFFASGGRFTWEAIRLKFISRCWSNDSEAVKLAILHFLANYLMGNELSVGFDRNYVAIIDSEDCYDYPWGKEIFEYLISHIVGKISETKTSVYNKCRGLIVVLQWWFYEICNNASGLISVKVDSLNSTIPRMLKWKANNSFGKENLVRKFFSLRYDQGQSSGDVAIFETNGAEEANVDKVVECYVVLLPFFLYLVGIQYKREELFTGDGPYVGKQLTDPLEVVFVDNLPSQERGDCGAFVAAFAEYFMRGLEIPSEFDVEFFRNHYAYLLYEHGCKKLAEGYESEDQYPRVMPPDDRKSVHRCWLNL